MYANLSDIDKTVLKYSILMGSFGVDAHSISNSTLNTIFVDSILRKYNTSDEVRERVINLVHYHDNGYSNVNKYFRTQEDMNLALILFKAKGRDINLINTKVNQSALVVHHNKAAAEKYPKIEVDINGETKQLPILKLSDLSPETDMTQYGYPNTKLKDITIQLHFCSIQNLLNTIKQKENPIKDFAISSSVKKCSHLRMVTKNVLH